MPGVSEVEVLEVVVVVSVVSPPVLEAPESAGPLRKVPFVIHGGVDLALCGSSGVLWLVVVRVRLGSVCGVMVRRQSGQAAGLAFP